MGKQGGPCVKAGKIRKMTPKVEKTPLATIKVRGRARMAKRAIKLDNPSCDCDLGTCSGNKCELKIHKIHRKQPCVA